MLELVIGGLIFATAVAVLALLWSYRAWAEAIDAEVRALKASAARNVVVVTDALLAPLPEPVRRYLRFSGVVGTPIPALVRVRQRGRVRAAPNARWMPFDGDEYYSTAPPAFVWKAAFPNRRLPLVLGRDLYREGAGSIVMKMLAVFQVADEGGGALRKAALVRYLNEMMWFPAAFLGANVTWSVVEDMSADVQLADRGLTVAARVFFDAAGRIANFRARRFNTGTGTVEAWETPISGYGVFGGLQLPSRGAGVWKLKDGDFTYIELEVTDVAIDRGD